jgi:hypothetical protein
MARSKRPGLNTGHDPHQMQINWSPAAEIPSPASHPSSATSAPAEAAEKSAEPSVGTTPPLVQRLPWDFRTTFPSPIPQAIDAGVIADEDAQPENLPAIHDEHAREMLMVLHDLNAVLDARRRGVDPMTGKPPRTPAAKERLEKLFETEPERLERWWTTLLDTYESVFGIDAAEAFGKAIKARHAGIEVVAEKPSSPQPTAPQSKASTVARRKTPNGLIAQGDLPRRRIFARLPVPRPLPGAVAAGHFGQDDNGPVQPGHEEVRAITEQHAEKLINLLEGLANSRPGEEQDRLSKSYDLAIAAYAEDFGEHASRQLDAYVRRQANQRAGFHGGKGRGR